MSPKVPKAYLDARREEIIIAAYKCFIAKGLHNTTMQDIYEATDLSPGAVYNYFNSKEDIVAAVMLMFTDWSAAPIEKVLNENTDAPFLKIFKYWFQYVMENDMRDYYGVQMDFYAAATRNKVIREGIIKSMAIAGDLLTGPVQQSQRAGLFNPKLNALSIAHIMVGMVFTASIHKMIEPDFDLENYEKVCEAMLTGTFASPHVKNKKERLDVKLRQASKEYAKKHQDDRARSE